MTLEENTMDIWQDTVNRRLDGHDTLIQQIRDQQLLDGHDIKNLKKLSRKLRTIPNGQDVLSPMLL
jgi:hypothetical protein